MGKKKKSRKQGRQTFEIDPAFKRWTQTDYLGIATNLLAHVQIHDRREPIEIQYGDDAEFGDIYLDTTPDPNHMSDAELFHNTLSQLITNGLECALDNLNRQKESKYKEGMSSINAALFSALYDVIFLRYNFDVATGFLDVPSAEEGEMLIKKVALFSETLESFKRESKTREAINSLKNKITDLEKQYSATLKDKEDELNKTIKEQKATIRQLEDRIHELDRVDDDDYDE